MTQRDTTHALCMLALRCNRLPLLCDLTLFSHVAFSLHGQLYGFEHWRLSACVLSSLLHLLQFWQQVSNCNDLHCYFYTVLYVSRLHLLCKLMACDNCKQSASLTYKFVYPCCNTTALLFGSSSCPSEAKSQDFRSHATFPTPWLLACAVST